MKIKLSVAIALTLVAFNAFCGQDRGGGDSCENSIQVIRDDLKNWIYNKGHEDLKLPDGMTAEMYSNSMLEVMQNTKIECVGEGDIGYPIVVYGVAKVCEFKKDVSKNQITCDYKKFQSMNEDDQYVLIHHEYAGLADLESPDTHISRYDISNQISNYLTTKVVKRLVVKTENKPLEVDPKYPSLDYHKAQVKKFKHSLARLIENLNASEINYWNQRENIEMTFRKMVKACLGKSNEEMQLCTQDARKVQSEQIEKNETERKQEGIRTFDNFKSISDYFWKEIDKNFIDKELKELGQLFESHQSSGLMIIFDKKQTLSKDGFIETVTYLVEDTNSGDRYEIIGSEMRSLYYEFKFYKADRLDNSAESKLYRDHLYEFQSYEQVVESLFKVSKIFNSNFKPGFLPTYSSMNLGNIRLKIRKY